MSKWKWKIRYIFVKTLLITFYKTYANIYIEGYYWIIYCVEIENENEKWKMKNEKWKMKNEKWKWKWKMRYIFVKMLPAQFLSDQNKYMYITKKIFI